MRYQNKYEGNMTLEIGVVEFKVGDSFKKIYCGKCGHDKMNVEAE